MIRVPSVIKADPGGDRPMAGIRNPAHEERFPQTRMSAGCGFRKETIVGMRRNGRDAPIPAVRAAAIKPLESAPSPNFDHFLT